MRISDWSSDVCSSDLGTALIDGALAVAHDDMIVRHAHRLYQFGAGDRRRPGAVDDHPDVRKLAPGQVTGVDQAGGGDDRGAVLVVVKEGDVHPILQRRFDDETEGRGDIFKWIGRSTGGGRVCRYV